VLTTDFKKDDRMFVIMKAKYTLMVSAAYVSAAFAAFLAPLIPTFVFVGFLVMSDFVTGVAKAQKKGNISSAVMIRKFYKSIGYFIGILVAAFCEMYFGDAVPFTKAVVAIIALTELQSLRENIFELSGTDILKPIINILQKKGEGE
jgi:phage-related holin